ncbi:MAG: TOTE conflict system archaeo-eukaryotic primase domain-containing protein [Schleiferiaceae bacterium]
MAIFDGLKEAHGYFKIEKTAANGKAQGKAGVTREPRTKKLWENHLSGKGNGLGIIPINEDNMCKWGCIDVDQYPLDHKLLVQKIRKLKLPLVVCRSKSGGAHCFLFSSEWVEAKDMQKALQHMSAALGYGESEIFPKQVKLHLDRGDVGNFLNLPYYDHENGLRYAFLDDGTSADLNEFIELYEKYAQTPEEVVKLQIVDSGETDLMKDGPPCLQILCKQRISEGGRNNGLFNIGVYLRKAYPDSWESEILRYNMEFLSPPLPLPEVNIVAKQLDRKDYAYKCSDAPISAHCNKELCRTRKFGIGAAVAGATIANLRKYNSTPPVWFMDVNGEPLELDTDALMSQPMFQKSCMEQLNFMPRSVQKAQWESRISTLMTEMRDNESAIIEVAQDASISGQFYDYLEEFCSHLQQAQDKEEILLRRPWTDEEEEVTYFRLKDFESYLKKNKFFEYKSHKIAQRLRDINGDSMVLKIKGRSVRVWKIPAFESADVELKTPSFGNQEEAPF